jgi:hypothetical protein
MRNGSERREVTGMGKAKKLTAATLTVLALAAVPATSLALNGGSGGVHLACNGNGGSGGCYG